MCADDDDDENRESAEDCRELPKIADENSAGENFREKKWPPRIGDYRSRARGV